MALSDMDGVLTVARPDVTDDGLPAAGHAVRVHVDVPVEAVIRFSPDGRTCGGGIQVRISGSARVVSVDWLTGRVSIVDAS